MITGTLEPFQKGEERFTVSGNNHRMLPGVEIEIHDL